MKFDTLVVNNVGGHPDSPNDLWRRQVVFIDLSEVKGVEWDKTKHVWIDLPERDFIGDHPEADVTIVHFVTDCDLSHPNCVGAWNISFFHSIENWRKALLETNSKFIYIWGNDDEINGKKLGELPGYIREKYPKSFGIDLYIYTKEM